MRFLFLHYAFPGPFRYLAAHLASLPGNEVVFASEFDRKDLDLPSVRKILLNKPKPLGRFLDPKKITATDSAERDIRAAVRRGASAAASLMILRRAGFVPDIVYASASMGIAFYLRDVFPEALLALHAEWHYTDEELPVWSLRRTRPPGLGHARERARNLVYINSLLECHVAVAASASQRTMFPPCVAARIQVMPRGVDTAFYSPGANSRAIDSAVDLSAAGELVTFSGRSQGARQGMPYFLRTLPRLFSARPRCHALILATGSDPAQVEQLRREARILLGRDAERAHILGFAPLKEYRDFLRASALHVYLTAPSALSAGLFEAMSCGCLVLGADTGPVREVIRHGENGLLHAFTDCGATADVMADLLSRAPSLAPLRQAARRSMVEHHDQRDLALRHAELLTRCRDAWLRGDDLPLCGGDSGRP